jgi:xanthine dehydrogenase accessory factor
VSRVHEWIQELCDLSAADEPAVLVTVAGIRGSSPREIGAKMIVTKGETVGTIGGGQLEYQATRIAAGMLGGEQLALRSFPLGPELGQCCGGVVEILFEPITDGMPAWLRDLSALQGQRQPAIIATRVSTSSPVKFVATADDVFGADSPNPDMVATARELLADKVAVRRNVQEFYEPVVPPDLNIAVFGAGHVGSAVVAALSGLDCSIRWIDNRAGIFRSVPVNVQPIESADPALEVAAMPPGSYYLIMTHSHALDFEICDRVLRRRDARYCGLIGSLTKRRRFEKRYRQQGMRQDMLDSLVCPIGIDGITGKKPAEIAVAVAAEVLRVRDSTVAASSASYADNVHPLGA